MRCRSPQARADQAALCQRRSLVVLLGLVAACQAKPKPGPESKQQVTSSTSPRLASATVFSDEVLWQMGPEVRANVVAVSTMADDPQYSSVVEQWPASLPRVAGVAEQIVATDPDRAILGSFTAAETRQAVQAAGVEVVVIEHFRGFDDYRHNVAKVAEAAGRPQAATTLLEAFDARREAIAEQVAQSRAGEPLTVISWSDGSVPGRHTTFHDAATLAGLTNLPAARGREGHSRVTAEQLVTWAPDWIVVPCAAPGDAAACERAKAAAMADQVLRATSAAQAGHVLAVPPRELYDVGAGMLDLADTLRENISRE